MRHLQSIWGWEGHRDRIIPASWLVSHRSWSQTARWAGNYDGGCSAELREVFRDGVKDIHLCQCHTLPGLFQCIQPYTFSCNFTENPCFKGIQKSRDFVQIVWFFHFFTKILVIFHSLAAQPCPQTGCKSLSSEHYFNLCIAIACTFFFNLYSHHHTSLNEFDDGA